MKNRRPRWPTWENVLEYWNSFGVPEISIRPFPPKRIFECPWDTPENYPDGHCFYPMSNPINDTALHLCTILPSKEPEFRIAYKLMAFCKSERLHYFNAEVLSPVFERHGETLYGWWGRNAKHVLPVTEADEESSIRWSRPQGEEQQATRWREIVQHAAEAWTAISREWLLVRVPRFMDQSSAEFQEYLARASKRIEATERAEYERLRRKFEVQ